MQMQNTLPKSWEWKELSEVCDINAGQAAPQGEQFFHDGTHSFIRVKHISDTENGFVKCYDTINEEAVKTFRFKLFPKGSILFPKSGMSLFLNKRARLLYDSYVVSHLAIITPKDGVILSEFLYYWSLIYRFSDLAEATTLPSINLSQISRVKIPVPPLATQKKIVTILEKAEELKRKRAEANETSGRIVQAMFAGMFGSVTKNEMNWYVKQIGDVCTVRSGGTPARNVKEYWEGGSIPWVGSNVCKDSEVTSPNEYITDKGLNNSSAKLFEVDTVLIALVGATIGKTGLLRIKAATNQNIAGIRPNKTSELNPIYLFYASQHLYPKFRALSNDSFKMANLSFIRSLEITVPPIELQNDFVVIAEQVESLKKRQAESTEEIDKLFDSLMQKAFNGELVT